MWLLLEIGIGKALRSQLASTIDVFLSNNCNCVQLFYLFKIKHQEKPNLNEAVKLCI